MRNSVYFSLVIFFLLIFNANSFAATNINLTVENPVLTSTKRIGRTTFEYTYQADIANKSSTAVLNVRATLSSSSSATTVIDGTLTTPAIPVNSTVTASDTYTISHDRRTPFDNTVLSWVVEADEEDDDDGTTKLSGTILDTNDFVLGIETPVVGAKVSLLGSSSFVLSDATGSFVLTQIVAGKQVLDIDTSTANPAPDLSTYSGFREAIEIDENINNIIERPLFLPRIDASSLTTIDPNTTTIVENKNIGVSITVPRNTAKNEDGSNFTGQLSISVVPNELAPAALPRRLGPGFLVTIQPVGVNFTRPVRITFPNFDKLPPNSETELWSLDADSGQFSVVGTGRVSADGSAITTISGGITQTDWHFPSPGQNDGTSNTDDTNSDSDGTENCAGIGSSVGLKGGCLSVQHTLASYRSLNEDRALQFIYNSDSANPNPIIPAEISLNSRIAVPNSFSAQLLDVNNVPLNVQRFSQATRESTRHAVQFDATQMLTGSYPYTLDLISHYEQSRPATIIADTVIVNNERNSSFGAGWTLNGLQQIHKQSGKDQVVVTEGNGVAKVFTPQKTNSTIKTDVAFVMDGSGSISRTDFQLQLEGYANAVRDAVIIPHDDSVAITVIQFSSGRAEIEIPLTRIDSDQTAESLAIQILAITQISGGTPLTEGVNTAVTALQTNPSGGRQVICVSTDGAPASERNALLAADAAIDAGIDEIDAIGIGSSANIDFLNNFVRRGSVFTASNFQDFSLRIGEKLKTLLAGSPPGDFSVLFEETDGSFIRRLKDGTEIHFTVLGLQTAMVDRNNNTTSYEYDADNKLITITDPVGKVTTLDYSNGLLETIIDPSGRVTRFEHSATNLTKIIDPDSSSRSFSYDANHLLKSQTNKRGFITQYNYDSAMRLSGSIRADATTREINPSKSLVLNQQPITSASNPAPAIPTETVFSTFVDGLGNAKQLRTDKLGKIKQQIDALGRTTEFSRDINGLITEINHPNNAKSELSYDRIGNLITLSNAVGSSIEQTIQFEYELEFNQPIKTTDAEGNITTIEYDSKGNPIKVTDPLGGVAIATFNTQGQLKTQTDKNGNTTTFLYEVDGNLKSAVDAEGNQTDFAYDTAGNITNITQAAGQPEQRILTITYDQLNRVLTSIDGTGAVTSFTYDSAGNRTQIITATGETTVFDYDTLDRLISINNPSSGLTELVRDDNGNLIKSTDSLGNQTIFSYDAENQLIETTDALDNTQIRTYDSSGNLKTLENALGNITSFNFDLLNRQITEINAKRQAINYAYDARDNLITVTDPKQQVITRSYDELSRLIELKTPDNQIVNNYDAVGNILTVDDNDSGLTFNYDKINRLLTATTSGTSQPAITITSAYNALSNRISLSEPTTGSAFYSYDNADRLTQLLTPENDTINLSYDPVGRLKQTTYPNTTHSLYDYDATGQLQELKHQLNNVDFQDFSYGYNAVGNITRIDQDAQSQDFNYDPLQRLIAAGTVAQPETYSYDAEGNRETSHQSSSHNHDQSNRLLDDDNTTYRYDANGNLETKTDKVSNAVTIYRYDAQNQLIGITFPDLTIAEYRYDGLGRRIIKTATGATTRYVYDGEDILLEYDEPNNFLARYHHGDRTDQPLSQSRGGQSYFYHANHQGSVQHLTNANGAIVNSYTYDAYGAVASISQGVENPYGYTGREYDQESGLYYYRARNYDPATGRFIQEDPLGLGAGDANYYRYVFNNPVNFSDPSGELVCGGACILAAAVFAYNVFETTNDFINAANVFSDDCSSKADQAFALGIIVLGIVDFTPGDLFKRGAKAAKSTNGLFKAGRTPKASELKKFAEQQGFKPSQSKNGPLKFVDKNGVNRITIKQGSSRAPGSANPHVELRNASGQRVDPTGNPVSRKSPGNHTPIDFDL